MGNNGFIITHYRPEQLADGMLARLSKQKSIIGLLEVLTNPSKSISHEKNYVFILSTQKLQSIKPF